MNPPPDLPGLPRDAEGPVFREPWEAQAFAMAVHLHDRGVFTWNEWAAALAAEIKAAGPADTGEKYYGHWLAALEKLVAVKALTTTGELAVRRDQWDRAARATPHGQPIALSNDPESAASLS
ncbi:MAG TPA: nitrile hydratase accessory protein [Candidatus Cybelea sp.]|nr:nitrile hydratase accessory protein [Candidatus Cybelea sp.]